MITLTFQVDTPEEAASLLNRLSTPAVVGVVEAPVSSGQAELGPKPSPELDPAPGIGVPPSPAPLASPAVVQLMQEHGIETDAITGTGKEGRVLKSDVTAYINAHTPPAVSELDPFALEDDTPAPAPAATKEQVRTALIGFQTALRDSMIAQGETEDSAKTSAMETARSLLTKAGNGAAILGALAESQYGAVVLAATAAMNELSA